MKISKKPWLSKNSVTFLSFAAVAGLVATAVTAVKATPKALILIREDSIKNHEGDPYAATNVEKFKSAWKCYIPAAAIGLSTVLCIFSIDVISKRQQAALVGAYSLISDAYTRYRNKVADIYGPEENDKILASIAVEKTKDVDLCAQTLFGSFSVDFEDDVEMHYFVDSFSGRCFESTFSKVLQAEYHLNRNFVQGFCATLNDFYTFLGLDTTDYGDAVGWFAEDGLFWIDFSHHKVELDGEPDRWVIDMPFEPIPYPEDRG
jgi:hypothetical protein